MLNGVYFLGCSEKDTFPISIGEKGLFSDESCETSGSAYENQPSLLKLGPIFNEAVADSFRQGNSQVHLSIAGL